MSDPAFSSGSYNDVSPGGYLLLDPHYPPDATPNTARRELQGVIRSTSNHPIPQRHSPYPQHRSQSAEEVTYPLPLSRSYSSEDSLDYSTPYTPPPPIQKQRARLPLGTRSAGNLNASTASIGSGLTPQVVDRMIDSFKLDHARQNIHRFAKADLDEKLLMLHMNVMTLMDRQDKLATKTIDLEKSLAVIKLASATSFELEKEAQKLISRLAKHFVMQPNGSYSKIQAAVSKHVAKNYKTLGLKIYGYNDVARGKIDKVIQAKTNDAKSALNKKVKQSIIQSVPLDTFAGKMIKEWHLTPKPQEPSQAFLAGLALLRKIAVFYVKKKTTRGVDSGYWTRVEDELTLIYNANGLKRDSSAWLIWERGIIDEDRALYNKEAPAASAASWDEIYGEEEGPRESGSAGDEDEGYNGDEDGLRGVEEGNSGGVDLDALNLATDIAPCGRD